jgi:hypothetical protein
VGTAALASDLLFGAITFLRILHRDKVTDEYKRILKEIRAQLKERSVSLSSYSLRFDEDGKWYRNGGLGMTTAAINSVLAACIAAIWIPACARLPSVVLAFVIAFAIHAIPLSRRNAGKV